MRPIHALLIALAAVGCKRDAQHEVEAAQRKSSSSEQRDPNAVSKPALTPAAPKPLPPPSPSPSSEASTTASDTTLVEKIRLDIANDAALSIAAKTVTVVARDGKVTLRGTVPTETERTRVVDIARKAAGDDAVDDQLQVQPN